MRAIRLKTEHLTAPMGVDFTAPQLFWNCEGGVRQTAWQILAADDGGNLLWDSGKTEGAAMRAKWGGSPVLAKTSVVWRVRLWDENGVCGEWSESSFETGIDTWCARWITGDYRVNRKKRYPVDCFRTIFESSNVKKARLYITACGLYEAKLNGQRAGDVILAPGITDYRRRVQYQTYDITPLLRSGENVLSVQLADGWYRGSTGAWGLRNQYGTETKLLAQLEITHTDGHVQTVCTDESWEWSNDGPIRFADNKDGEVVDAGCAPSYNGKAKATAHPVTPSASDNVAVREHERLHAQLLRTPAGKTVLDFGQNIAGYAAFTLTARAGQTVTLRFGEMLDENGEFTQKNIQLSRNKFTTPLQQVIYTCKDGANAYKTTFAIFGFRYVLVETKIPFKAENFTAIAVYSDMERTGWFESSNPLLDKFVENTVWSAKNNHADLPTDCPTRERHGWSGDAQIFCPTACFLFDYEPMAEKFLNDMYDWQRKSGCLPQIAPSGGTDFYMYTMNGSVGWADAGVIMPYVLWKQYGDKQTLRSAYPGLRAWTMYLTRQREDGIVCYSYYGDWASPVGGSVRGSYGSGAVSSITPGRLISTGYLYLNCMLLAQMADVLMLEEDHAYFRELAAQTCSALNRAFLNREGGFYAGNSQAANTFMLYLGVVPEQFRAQVLQNLIRDIQQHDTHVTTGNLCTRYILDVLADNGEIDLAYALVTQTTYPSWGYMLACGATTVWERWEYVDSGELVGMASHDHPMYAAVSGWFYRCLAGLRPDAPAFSRFTLQPYFPRELPEIRCTLHTVKGEIRVEWTQRGGEVRLLVRIPFNASAVWKPTLTLRRLLIDGAPAPDAAEYPLGAGTHSIEFERNDQ